MMVRPSRFASAINPSTSRFVILPVAMRRSVRQYTALKISTV
jgi:hypothetical protein